MKPEDVIRDIMRDGAKWHGDCADLAIHYVSRVKGIAIERPERALSVSAVTDVLGRARRGAPVYGDVVLHRGGLGIFIDYAVLTVDERNGLLMRRKLIDSGMLAWGVTDGC